MCNYTKCPTCTRDPTYDYCRYGGKRTHRPMPLIPLSLVISLGLGLLLLTAPSIAAAQEQEQEQQAKKTTTKKKSPLSHGPWGPTHPVADPGAVVVVAKGDDDNNGNNVNVRFTVLTDRLIRMEQGPGEDRKTLAVINRKLPIPNFTAETRGGVLTITTRQLQLRYTIGQPFDASSLQVTGKMKKPAISTADEEEEEEIVQDDEAMEKEMAFTEDWVWKYGDDGAEGNLLGTIRTLDGLNVVSLNCSEQPTGKHCVPGLISRNGYALVDDSENWALDDEFDWWIDDDHDNNADESNQKNRNDVDLYLFGHGHDYKDAVKDYVKIGGRIPLLPRYALGVWFSRWYDYNPSSAKQVVDTFEQLSLPLDVFVLDMNWHTKNAWTGYSFDKHLYNPPQDATAYLKFKNLAVTLNLHDAQGVNAWEDQYEALCESIGWDSSTTEPVPFSIVNRTIMLGLEDIVLKHLEDVNGIDFWWIDWQQGEDKGGGDGDKKNPTMWTAHTRSTDRNRRNQTERAMVLARWGGLGAHRYPVHFSGDADISWEQLSFQPYFSMTATNVGAIWSHDVSGDLVDPELFTRWLQWSVFSGVTRVHDKGSSAGKCALQDPETCTAVEPWNAPPMYALANYEALRTRGALLPYIYTAAYTAHRDGLWFVRPLYYDYPDLDGAYVTGYAHPNESAKYESQYMFGDNLMVAPVVRPANATTGLTALDLWIPPGTWVGMEGGRVVVGDDEQGTPLRILADINDIPVFVQAGSIIPSIPVVKSGSSTLGLARKQYEHLIWTVFTATTPKGGNTPLVGYGKVYEDDGVTTDYLNRQSTKTTASYSIIKNNDGKINDESKTATVRFIVETTGSYRDMLSTRATTVRFVNLFPPSKVVALNATLPYSRFGGVGTWSYDVLKAAVVVEVPPTALSDIVTVELDTYDTIPGNVATDGVGFQVLKALSAKAALDQIRKAPGSQTGQDKSNASLMQAASAGSSLEFLANDQASFLTKLDSFQSLMGDAYDEVKALLISSLDDRVQTSRLLRSLQGEEIGGGVLNRVARAYDLLKETK